MKLPITLPRMPALTKIAKRRLACRASHTAPAMFHDNRPTIELMMLIEIHSTG